jgi:hypothetical protein
MQAVPVHFMILVHRMPARPTANRVYVWRMLKKVGGVSLQQSVTVFPRYRQLTRELQPILKRITDSKGEYHLLSLRPLAPLEMEKIVGRFVDQATRHYGEIIENCEVNFTKEVEFETFRRNFTYEEAEEIRAEYDKIISWFERVRQRDWFGAPNRAQAAEWLQRCQAMLEEFEARVFAAQAGHEEHVPGARDRPVGRRRGPAAPRSVPSNGARAANGRGHGVRKVSAP